MLWEDIWNQLKTVLFGNQCCERQCCARPRCTFYQRLEISIIWTYFFICLANFWKNEVRFVFVVCRWEREFWGQQVRKNFVVGAGGVSKFIEWWWWWLRVSTWLEIWNVNIFFRHINHSSTTVVIFAMQKILQSKLPSHWNCETEWQFRMNEMWLVPSLVLVITC